MKMIPHRVLALLFAAALLPAAACARAGDLQTETRSIDAGAATSVRVKVEMGAGRLTIDGVGGNLMTGEFAYNVESMKPEVSYTANGGRGDLKIRQGSSNAVFWTDVRNDWTLRLGPTTPIDLDIEMGAGTSDIRLGGLDLTGLRIDMGTGDGSVDLSGRWQRGLDARIEGGAGRLKVRVPRDVGVRVEAENGLGKLHVEGLTARDGVFTNDVYGTSPITLRLKVSQGVGKLTIEQGE